MTKKKNSQNLKEFQCARLGCSRVVVTGKKGVQQPYYNWWTSHLGPRLCSKCYKFHYNLEPHKAKGKGKKKLCVQEPEVDLPESSTANTQEDETTEELPRKGPMKLPFSQQSIKMLVEEGVSGSGINFCLPLEDVAEAGPRISNVSDSVVVLGMPNSVRIGFGPAMKIGSLGRFE